MEYRTILCVAVFLLSCTVTKMQEKHRVKRRVLFSKSSKFFFRLNGKENVINETTVFAHGWSIRINYDLPHTEDKRKKMFKRDIKNEIANIPDESLQGFSCVFKHFCDSIAMLRNAKNCGFLCQLGNIIKRSQGQEADFLWSFLEKCDYHTDTCPDLLSEDLLIDSFG